ncbi:MAG TPA: sigma-70 family RNA polymerase sigma factor [Acetobacteraceae bacterium]
MSDIAALLEPHIPALRRYAYALTRDHAAADDLVQDCLERAVSRWYLRGTDAQLRAWLFTILHNLFVSALRTRRRRPLHDDLDKTTDAAVSVPPSQECSLAGREMLERFGALSADHQEVLLLIGVEGMPYASVARVLGVPVGTVMSRLSRAREQFRRLLDGERPALRRVK